MLELGKILTWLVSPLTVSLAALLLGTVCFASGRRRAGSWLCVAATVWLLVWSTPALGTRLRHGLMDDYPPQPVEALPVVDAIVVLGGGMVEPLAPVVYPEFSTAGNRFWHAARLYKAGKAPVVISSGSGEDKATVPFLKDLGVPAAAIRVENASRNTEANARLTADLLTRMGARRILLVTSSWHMRRAQYLFTRAGVEAIPSASDYEASLPHARAERGNLLSQFPNPETLSANTLMLKEYLGYYWVSTVRGWLIGNDTSLVAR